MRSSFDFSPLFRSTVGFDRMLDVMNQALSLDQSDGHPPYDIVKLDEERYRITMAVAGFTADELTVTLHPNLLVVAGRKPEREGVQYLYRGIGTRVFERRFELADWVKVTGASLADGLLTVELLRELPEEKRPRRIEIRTGKGPLAIESRQGDAGERHRKAA
jgi:molecular chaperone IbpA